MLEKEAREKWCPIISFRGSTADMKCVGSDCMMWGWDAVYQIFRKYKSDESLEIALKKKGLPADGWNSRSEWFPLDYQRLIPQSEREGSCGLANLTVYVEGP